MSIINIVLVIVLSIKIKLSLKLEFNDVNSFISKSEQK